MSLKITLGRIQARLDLLANTPQEGEYKDDEGNIRCCRCKEMRRQLVPPRSIFKSKELFAKVKATPEYIELRKDKNNNLFKYLLENTLEYKEFLKEWKLYRADVFWFSIRPDLRNSRLSTRKCRCKKLEESQQKEYEKKTIIARNKCRAFGAQFKRYENSSFTTDDGKNKKLFTFIKRYVENIDENIRKGKGIVFYGDTGTGKTFAAASILNEIIKKFIPKSDQIYTGCITNFTEIIQDVQKNFASKFDSTLLFKTCSLLVIDDFGSERKTSFAKEIITDIINSRYNTKKPIILTTNINMKDKFGFNCEDEMFEKRIYSRLIEMCMMVHVTGRDRRLNNAC